MRLFLLAILCLVSWQSLAVIETYEFESAEIEAEYHKLIDELRCLVCQNQNLADSDADLARDMRREAYTMLSEGKSSQQVKDFMVARYGDFVLYRPPFQASTWLLWLGPAVLLIVVLFFVQRRLRSASASAVDAKSLEAARKILEDDDPDRKDES